MNTPKSFFLGNRGCAIAVALAATLLAVVLSGCGAGMSAGASSESPVVSGFKGIVHGGPTPIANARVVLYATSSSSTSSYGSTAAVLTEASQVGTAHQDTDANGNFSFPAVPCPTGQFAYIVVYGGNTGGGNNPNLVLMAPVGSCDAMYTGSTFNGGFLVVNELTTIASAYALGNFMSVTGNAVSGYTVNVNAPASNNGAYGCVANTYYTVTLAKPCATTVTAGLKHAFANAAMLVNSSGTANATNANGALIPTALLNSLGNTLESCVNSTGGGTNATTGLPTTATSSSGTSNDGTICGKLFAYTSYTLNGAATGTLVAAGDTLDAMINLAKRPSGSPTLFDTGCSSNTTGSTPAATCVYNLGSSNAYYTTAMTVTPPDWMVGISYAKGTFGATVTSTNCSSGSTVSFTSTGLFYPTWLATDIDDNITVLDTDGSSEFCTWVHTLGYDGTAIGSSAIFNNSTGTTALAAKWVSTDAYGHAIVPEGSANLVNVYAAGSADTGTIGAPVAITTANSGGPVFSAVESNGDIYLGGEVNATSNFQVLTAGTLSHTAPTYTDNTVSSTLLTSKLFQMTADINGNLWSMSSSSSTAANYSYAPGATAYVKTSGTGSSSNGIGTAPDTSGNVWTVLQDVDTTHTDIKKLAYGNPPTASNTTGPSTLVTQVPTAAKQTSVVMDGNNVLWWSDTSAGATNTYPTPVTQGYVRGYDTVNAYATPQLLGCKFQTGITLCGSQGTTNSNTPYVVYSTRGLAADSAGDLWLANGSQGQVNEIIGLAAPTLPLFIHNGTSNKP